MYNEVCIKATLPNQQNTVSNSDGFISRHSVSIVH